MKLSIPVGTPPVLKHVVVKSPHRAETRTVRHARLAIHGSRGRLEVYPYVRPRPKDAQVV